MENAEDIIRTLRYQFAAELSAVPSALPVQEVPQTPLRATSVRPLPTVSPQQVVRELPANLTDDERMLLSSLSADGKLHIDSLIQTLDADCAAVSRRLLVLELHGLVRQWPGMYYSLA